MFDKAGADYCGTLEEFGYDFVISKLVRCQLHYQKYIYEISLKTEESYRGEFRNSCQTQCTFATDNE